jgi:ferredoxin-nitrite reductase
MTDQEFSPEQQRYLSGLLAGLAARQKFAPADPDDGQRQAQDRILAAGGTLSPIEQAKRARHPLDRMDDIEARARAGRFPQGEENFLSRWHGLFYVAPAQNAYMCRLRIPGGIISAHQFRGVAAIADDLAGGFADCTTRANLQLRGIGAKDAPEVLTRLCDIGLTGRGSGADNVRNITGSPTAGIDAQELLDTRPHTRALHHHILNTRALYGLPRKFNIAYDGGGRVPVLEDTNDVGFTAARVSREGKAVAPGVYYRLALGGITGHRAFAQPTGVAIAPGEATRVADAILRVFIREGDRTDRTRARLKYLLDAWGMAPFLASVEAQLGESLPRVDDAAFDPPLPQDRLAHLGVHTQKQPGLRYIGVALPVGRMTSARMRGLADIAERLGTGTIRLTVWQNLIMSDVPEAQVDEAVAAIRAFGLDTKASSVRAGLVACTGNAGCKFAASDTKRHAAGLADALDQAISIDGPLNIHLTGCPNSCAQHLIADIGLIATRVERGEDSVEGYDLHVGGGAGPAQAVARLVREKIAADALPAAVLGLLQAWQSEQPDQSFARWAGAQDDRALAALCGAVSP